MSLLSHSFVEETHVRETIRERVTEPDAEHARMKARNGHVCFGGWKAGILYFFVKWIAACPLFLWFIINPFIKSNPLDSGEGKIEITFEIV